MSAPGTDTTPSPLHMAPPLRRRLACFIYEGVLLFGVVMLAGLLFSSLTQQRHALQGRHELQAFMFAVLALYFVWFWSHGGQTLAMKTWRLRLVDSRGAPVGYPRALLRFLCSWIWFVPSLGASWLFSWQGKAALFGAMVAWVLLYAALALLHPRRQFWHDVLCRTQLLHWEPAPAGPRAAATPR